MELTKQEKQKILFSYMQKKKGISSKKAQEELIDVGWDISKLFQEKEVPLFGEFKEELKEERKEPIKKNEGKKASSKNNVVETLTLLN